MSLSLGSRRQRRVLLATGRRLSPPVCMYTSADDRQAARREGGEDERK